MQQIADRLAAELAAVEDGRLAGVLVVPVQREADAAALRDLAWDGVARARRPAHRAAESDDGDVDDERRRRVRRRRSAPSEDAEDSERPDAT